MKTRNTSILFSLCLMGCFGEPKTIDLDEIEKGFVENIIAFEKLKNMIHEDNKTESFFTVSGDIIGKSRYLKNSDKWGDGTLTTNDVLQQNGISHERYQTYLALLEETGSTKITHFPEHVGTIEDVEDSEYLLDFMKEAGVQMQDHENNELLPESFSHPEYVSLLVSATGIVTAGCTTEIKAHEDGSVPETENNPSYTVKIVPVSGGWYLSHSCN